MKVLNIRAVILTDGEKYLIHGTSDDTPAELFKAMTPIWNFDPSREMAHFVELQVAVPELSDLNAPLAD